MAVCVCVCITTAKPNQVLIRSVTHITKTCTHNTVSMLGSDWYKQGCPILAPKIYKVQIFAGAMVMLTDFLHVS